MASESLITDAMVEAACAAHWPGMWPGDRDQAILEIRRADMRKTLQAALAPAEQQMGTPAPQSHLEGSITDHYGSLNPSPVQHVQVRPLEWIPLDYVSHDGHSGRQIVATAKQPYGIYSLEKDADDKWWILLGSGKEVAGPVNHEADAKTEAQQDLVRRIHAALFEPPPPQSNVVVSREAARLGASALRDRMEVEAYHTDMDAERELREAALAWVADYTKSDGTTDYYVMIGEGDRAMSLHMHSIRGRAEYEAAEINHALTGSPKPEFEDFDLDTPPPQPNLSGWQNVSTAPVGKSVIICTWWKHNPSSAFRAEGYLDRDTKTWRNQDGSPISEDRTQPTHWMHIPEAPNATPAPETNLVPSIERLADLIDDAAPGILRLDTRLQIASRLRAVLATTGGPANE